MCANSLETEWFDGAIDDGTITVEAERYAVEISSDRASTLHTLPTSIGYSPEVNAAKRVNISVPPNPNLTNDDYLGGNLKLIIDGKGELDFDIKRINTTQKEGEDYEIRAFSKGQKLTEVDTEEDASNVISFDYLGKLVDAYNEIPSELSTKSGTGDESLTNIVDVGAGVLGVSSSASSGTANYQDVGNGNGADELDVIYAKLYVPDTSDITVEVRSGNNNSHFDTYSGLQKNRYGEWVAIDPGDTFDGDGSNYEVIFTLESDARLVEWRAIHNQELSREILTPDIASVDINEDLYSVSGEELGEEGTIVTGEDEEETGIVYSETDEEYRTREISQWWIAQTGDGDEVSDTGAVYDFAFWADAGGFEHDHSFFVEDKFHTWEYWARVRTVDSYSNSNGWRIIVDVSYDGSSSGSLDFFSPIQPSSNYEWRRVAGSDFNSSFPEPIEPGKNFHIGVQTHADSEWEVYIDCFCLVLGEFYQDGTSAWTPDYTFDPNLNNGHLSTPRRYGSEGAVDFDPFISRTNIASATTNLTIGGGSGTILDDWGVVQRIDDTTTYPDEWPNNDAVQEFFPYPGVSHSIKVKLSARGQNRDDTPRKGYEKMTLTQYDVNVITNDLAVIYDRSISGNNLSSMDTVASDTDALFRFEGSHAKIFQLGALTTSPNLKKERVNSSVSIEDAYSSVEVVGLHNVRSDVISSDDAPSWLDRHKTIRDDSIEEQADAVSRAYSFLRKNGDVQYSGEIETLPTFAPVGAMVDGSMFNHGQDMIIQSVRYSKNRTKIQLGYVLDVGNELLKINEGQGKSKGRQTGKGMKIPVGGDNV